MRYPHEEKNRQLESEYEKYFRLDNLPGAHAPLSLRQPNPDRLVWGVTTYGLDEEPIATWLGAVEDR